MKFLHRSIIFACHARRKFIEARDSRMGYLVPGSDGPCRALARLGELLGRRRRRRRHLEVQVDIHARELYLEFSNWILTHVRALGILIPEFYTEIRAESI